MAQIQQTDLKSLLIVEVLVKVINRLNVFPFSVSIFITFSDLSSFFRAQKKYDLFLLRFLGRSYETFRHLFRRLAKSN